MLLSNKEEESKIIALRVNVTIHLQQMCTSKFIFIINILIQILLHPNDEAL